MENIGTPKAFRNAVERLMRNTHPDASVCFAWKFVRRVKWADGTNGYSGVLTVTAPGYRPRDMVASFGGQELSVQ